MGELRRSKSDVVFSGVLGGIAKQYSWDASMLRLIYYLITLFSAGLFGVIVYLAAAMIIPEEDNEITVKESNAEEVIIEDNVTEDIVSEVNITKDDDTKE